MIVEEKLAAMVMSQSVGLLESCLTSYASPIPLMPLMDQKIRGSLGVAQSERYPPLQSFFSTRTGAQHTAYEPEAPEKGFETVIWPLHTGDGRSTPHRGSGGDRVIKSQRTANRHDSSSENNTSDEESHRSHKGRGQRRGHSRQRQSSTGRRKSERRYSSSSDSDRSDTDSDGSERRRRARRSNKNNARLKVIRPLNELFTKAVYFRQYRLQRKDKAFAGSSSEKMNKYRKRLDVYMTGMAFTGSDQIAVLEFLASYKRACDLGVVTEGVAVWPIQFHLTGQAEGLIQSKLAVDEEGRELLTSYREVVNCLLEKYATDEIIAEAYADVINFRHGSAVQESAFDQSLWDKTARCGAVFSDRRRKQLFAEGFMDSIRSQVVHQLSNHSDMTYQSLVKFAQGLGNTYRAARGTTSRVEFEDHIGLNKCPVPRRFFSVETSSTDVRSDLDDADQDGVLAIEGQDGRSYTSRSSIHPYSTTPTRSQTYPPPRRSSDTVTSHSRGAYIRPTSIPLLATPIVRTGPSRGRPSPDLPQEPQRTNCRLCFGSHTSESCPEVPTQLRDQLLATREQNYVTRRTEGTLPSQRRQCYPYNPRQPFHGSGQSAPVSNVNEIETGLEHAESSTYGTPAEIPNDLPTEVPHGLEENGQDRAWERRPCRT